MSSVHTPLAVILCLVVVAAALGAEFEAPPAPAQTYPRPRDGETLAANPPCFVYPAVNAFPAYVVEYSRSKTFEPAATHTLTGKWMLNAPEQPLETGPWYWRWRPGTPTDGQTVWSPVRRFTVPAEAPVLPFPDIPELIQRLGTTHPRVFTPAARLPEVRRQAVQVNEASWRRQVAGYAERMRTEDLLPEPAPLPDWKHGRLEKYQQTFVKYRPFFAEMTRLAQDYLLTGNELSGQEAKRRLLSIMTWDPEGSTALHHNDEVGTDVVRHCPRAFDWIYPLLTPAERERCLAVFRVRMQEMYETLLRLPFEKKPYESHRMGYYLPDLLQACLAVSGDMDVSEMLHYTMLQLWSPFYPPYGDADGGWNEGPSYWGWIAGVCAHTYRLVERATGIPVYKRSHLRNQVYYKLYGNPPWFKMSPFGDGQEGPARGGNSMLMLASLYGNPYARWYADQMNGHLSGLDALLFPVDNVPATPPLDLPQGRCFFDVGLACSHTNLADGSADVAFLLRSCPFGGYGHAYADQNTFVLDAYGEPLIIASGYYQLYGCPHHRQWTWQTKASNSILVDGKGQERSWNAKGRVTEFATTLAGDYTVGDAHAAYPGLLDRYERRALFLRPLHTGGEALVVIHDQIQAKQPATFQFLLHALHRMAVDEKNQTVTVRQGRSACRVDYLEPTPLRFEQDDKFTVPPPRPAPNQWHLRAGTTRQSTTATSLLVLQPTQRGDENRLPRPELHKQDGAVGVTLKEGRRRLAAVFRDGAAPGEWTLAGVRTDGQAASLAWDGEVVESALLVAGTFLAAENGPTLVCADEVTSLSVSRLDEELLLEAASPKPVTVAVHAPFTPVRAVDERGKPVSFTPTPAANIVTLTLPPQCVVRLTPKGTAAVTGPPARLYPPCAATAQFDRRDLVRVGEVRYQAAFPASAGIWRLGFDMQVHDASPCRVQATAGGASTAARFAGATSQRLEIPAASLAFGEPVVVSVEGPAAGSVQLVRATAERVRGVNLLPRASFEEAADGVPVGWRPGTITRQAQCRIASATGGADGDRCVEVECTAATGGDFGATLTWPGVRPTPYPRRFRLACRVRTDPTDPKARAGVQVTAADWIFCQTTPRIASPDKWTETAREFVLPAGENLTHLRLHLTAGKEGAKLYADQVVLEELPAPPATQPAQIPLCMVGDSITWWSEGDWWRKDLVERIPRLAFVGTHTAKFGYSHAGEGGNSTGNVLARLDAIPACPYYHLLIGTNDNNTQTAAEVAPRAQRTADRIRQIVLRLLDKPGCRKVFLGSILPCHTDNPLRDETNAATNVLLRTMLKEGVLPSARVVWVEYEQPLRKRPDWQSLIRLHPTAEGYKLLADLLADALTQALNIENPAASLHPVAGAGVLVDNLWEGDADGGSRVPLIAGRYTLSFDVEQVTGDRPTVTVRSLGDVEKPLEKEFALPAEHRSDGGRRVHFEFYTGAEGYEYSRSRVAVTCRGVRISRILLEKKRPGGVVSTYGRGAFVDAVTPPQPGEWVVFP